VIQRDSPVSVAFPSGLTIVAIAAGYYHSAAIDSNGAVWTWREATNSDSSESAQWRTLLDRVRVMLSASITKIACGHDHMLALGSVGSGWAWGTMLRENSGLAWGHRLPFHVLHQAYRVCLPWQLAAQARSLFDRTRVVFGWGTKFRRSNGKPQRFTSVGTPTGDCRAGSVRGIAAGYFHVVAIKNDGAVWTWGGNGYAQLGISPTTSRYTPSQVQSTRVRQCVIYPAPRGFVIQFQFVVTMPPATTPFCGGAHATLTASGAVSYDWSPAPGLGSPGHGGSVVDVSPTETTTYEVTGTTADGCTGTAFNSGNGLSAPDHRRDATPSTLCSRTNTTLTASGGSIYRWEAADGLNETAANPVVAHPVCEHDISRHWDVRARLRWKRQRRS